jgi:MFS family permease
VVGVVISAHIAGMYALSPVFGILADRWGRVPVVVVGLALLAASTLVAGTSGAGDQAQVLAALVLLGLGWSACVVAGSTLLSEAVAPAVRTAVQGLSDLVMGVAAAVAGLLAGPALAVGGYGGLAAMAAALLVPVTVLVLVPRRGPGHRDRQTADIGCEVVGGPG